MPLPLVQPVVPPERCLLCGGRHQTHLRADGRRMLTVEEAARHLNVGAKIVRRLIDTGELKAVCYSPRNTRIKESDLVAFQER
jgi:excisionase family DNA binding protein